MSNEQAIKQAALAKAELIEKARYWAKVIDMLRSIGYKI